MDTLLPKQKLTIGPTSIQRWIPTSDCRRKVGMMTLYSVGTTPISNLLLILITNIFSTSAINISKIQVTYFYYKIHVLWVKTCFKEDYQCRINFLQTFACYSVNYQSRLDTGWTLHIRYRKITFSTVGRRLDLLYTQCC